MGTRDSLKQNRANTSRRSSSRRNGVLVELARRRVSVSEFDTVVSELLSGLNCPRALTVWMLWHYKEHAQLMELECNPSDYDNPVDFRDSYTATELFSKSDFLEVDVDREARALEKFRKAELQCAIVNKRFRNLALDPLYKGSNCWLLHATGRKIAEILGDHVDTVELFSKGNWGPGVSTQITGEHVSATNKFCAERGITRDCASLVFADGWFPSQYPLWANHLESLGGIVYEVGNEVTTVPKSAKIDRVIAIEPGLNLWFQKAVGSLIRSKLKSVGLDLNTGQTVNQHRCKHALKKGLVTVDFSSASDCIAYGVVREVLPPDWFEVADAFRSKYGQIDGESLRWEKFSSMGNGFTFELETLIFYAAALSACEYAGVSSEDVTVYGDDVILPSDAFDVFHSFCTFLGFSVNLSKTHVSGMFRESCGVHYYGSVDCTPLYLKGRSRYAHQFILLANRIRRLAHRRCSGYACDSALKAAWESARSSVPKALRSLSVPDGYGDGGFISNFDEAVPVRARHGVEGYYTSSLMTPAVTAESFEFGHELSGLWRLEDVSSPSQSTERVGKGNTYALRGRVRMRITNRMLVHSWYDLGPWL